MSSYNRGQFKPAKLENNKLAASSMDVVYTGKTTRAGHHPIDIGSNIFRILPPHNSETDPSFQPLATYFLETLNDEYVDGKPTGKQIRSGRPIFDSRVHGGTEKDIVDEFIKFAKKIGNENYQDKEDRDKRLACVTGFKTGIMPVKKFICYATKGAITPENIGRLEMYAKLKNQLEELNFGEGSNEPVTVDILSDPDNGFQVNIIAKDEGGKRSYSVRKVEMPSVRGLKGKELEKKIDEWEKSQRVPDEVLQKLGTLESLVSLYRNSYKRSDFERALEALQHLDEHKLKFGIFQNPEFIAIVDEIDAYYADAPVKKGSDLDDLTREKLVEYVEEKELDISRKKLKTMTEDQIRDEIRRLEAESEYDEDDREDEDDLPFDKD